MNGLVWYSSGDSVWLHDRRRGLRRNAGGDAGQPQKTVCNGKACGNTMPGPGAKGVGDVAIRNYEAWQKVRINLNTIAENKEPDTGFDFFGKRMKYPIFAGPVGAVNLHYGDKLDDIRYNDILVRACREAGIAAFTGDGTNAEVMKAATAAIRAAGGADREAVGCQYAEGEVCTGKGVRIVCSRHGCGCGRASISAGTSAACREQDGGGTGGDCPDGREAVHRQGRDDGKGSLGRKGGWRVSHHCLQPRRPCAGPDAVDCGGAGADCIDVFKALALGADAVLIARPYVTAVYGGAEEGVKLLTEKLGKELADTMKMCGVSSLSRIGKDNLFLPQSRYVRF